VLIDAKAHRWTVKGLFFGVLLGMLAVLAVLPAQAETLRSFLSESGPRNKVSRYWMRRWRTRYGL